MAVDEDLVCWECVTDAVLRQWLRANGHAGRCSFCGKWRIACLLPDVAQKIDGALRGFYHPAEETGHVVEESDNPQYWADGENASEIIQQIAGVEPAVADAVDQYLSSYERRGVNDGEEAYYGEIPLEHVRTYPEEYMGTWLHFEERLKHDVRFFDDEGKRLLDELFADLPSLAGGRAIVTLAPTGEFSTFYRARIVDHGADAAAFVRDPARQIGPPPPYLARAGRMNPVGIPAFYGAFSEEVALAEIRPPVGAVVAVGKFSLLRAVRLLDFSFLPFAYHEESIFSPAYDRLRNKVGFLEKFHRRISRPVLPSDEALEYLPTQAVAAYVANIMELNGVIYGSTQIGAERGALEQVERTMCNLVLFGEAARVEGAHPQRKPAENPGPQMFAPGRVVQDAAEAMFTLTDPPEFGFATIPPGEQPVTVTATEGRTYPAPEAPPPPVGIDVTATLRAEPQPKLLKIRSVRVETSSMFAHLYEDGSVIIRDSEDEDD